MNTKPCIVCRVELEPVGGDWKCMQPYHGGEVQFIFAYGSRKFDFQYEDTVFCGVICDDCAKKLIKNMERTE